MYLMPGFLSFDELVKKLNNGVIITDLKGLHSGVNTVTGDMSLEAKGYLVENGIITISNIFIITGLLIIIIKFLTT